MLSLILGGCKSATSTDNEQTPKASSENAQAEPSAKDQPAIKTLDIEIFQPSAEEALEEDPDGPGNTTSLTQEVYASVADALCIRDETKDELEQIRGKCLLKTPFIIESQYKQFDLKLGDIFITEKSNTRYQVISDIPEEASVMGDDGGFYIDDFIPCRALGHENLDCNTYNNKEKIIRIKVLSD